MPKVLSLDKSLSMLELIFQCRDGIGTRDLARRLNFNVATVHNIAMTFCNRGYLRQDPGSKHFYPGLRVMLLGRHPLFLDSLTSSASPIVDELAGRLNESILLGSIDHGRVLNLKYVPSPQALRVHEPEDISDYSYCTAFGKVLLASLPEAELEAYLRKTRLRQFTPKTICNPSGLRDELQKVRNLGCAQTRDEHSQGVSAVAVPIHDPWGMVIASLGASAPTVRMQKAGQFKKTLTELRRATAAIEQIWGEAMENKPQKKNPKHPNRNPTL